MLSASSFSNSIGSSFISQIALINLVSVALIKSQGLFSGDYADMTKLEFMTKLDEMAGCDPEFILKVGVFLLYYHASFNIYGRQATQVNNLFLL